MARILSIDYGKRRVGVAVTDPLQIIAGPLTVVDNSNFKDWLKKYLDQEDVGCLVLGMPKRLNGEPTHITQEVEELVIYLKETYASLEVVTVDERLTSKMAKQSLIDSGVPKQKRKQKGALDSVSASLILQSYLSSKK